MVPSHWVLLDALPLSPNGKIDRNASPAPERDVSAHEAPASPAEQALAAVWEQVMGLTRVGRADNFFELGGDSIIALQVVGRAREAGISITPRQLFEHQTVQALARVARIDAQAGAAAFPLRRAARVYPARA